MRNMIRALLFVYVILFVYIILLIHWYLGGTNIARIFKLVSHEGRAHRNGRGGGGGWGKLNLVSSLDSPLHGLSG